MTKRKETKAKKEKKTSKEKKKFKIRLTGWWKKPFVNRRYKDELFRMVFQDKKDLLELYNAVNHTDYRNPDELEITTLGSVIYMSMKNDLSFMIGFVMNLYEHQSTFNPNMPVRGLLYFARLYEMYIKKNKLDIYGKTLVRLPMPQYIAFYNGREEQPDEMELKLSDAFKPDRKNKGVGEGKAPRQEPALECRVRMLNINMGRNQKLMQKCRRLWEYAAFVEEVNQNLDRGYPLEKAAEMAMDACIQKNILKDVLIKSRNEVMSMLLTEFDAKRHWKHTYEEGRAEGIKTGRTEGLRQGQKRILSLNRRLIEDNRLEELKRASIDDMYREELMKEYGL